MKTNPPFSIVIFSIFLLMGFLSCSSDMDTSSSQSAKASTLFSLLPSSETGVRFNNKITQTADLNVLNYSYLLNGGGVATGDFNNDGLPDLFFTGNQVADKLYLNKGDLEFEDISEKAGIEYNQKQPTWSTGVTLVDINQDGWLDIYICKAGAERDPKRRANLLYVNNKDLTFTEKAAFYRINDMGFSNQATFFDYDRDGDLDLYVMNHSFYLGSDNQTEMKYAKDPQKIKEVTGHFYRNSKGTYVDVTAKSNLEDYAYGLGVVASDWDKDGSVDLYVTSDFSVPDLMYRNEGATFNNVVKTATKHIPFYGMGVDVSDFDNDGFPDIGVLDMAPPDQLRSKTLMPSMDIDMFWSLVDKGEFQYQYMFNTLQLNRGNGTFSDIAKMSGVHKTDWSWAVLFADFDNDGLKDQFVTNGFRNDVTDNDLTREYKERRIKLGNRMSNEERKSWLDKINSQKLLNPIFKNKGNLTFEAVNEDWGLTTKSWSNGAIYVDLDRDGDLEIVTNNIDESAFIYRNNANQKTANHYLDIQFKGYNQNKNGLNTKVTLYANGQTQYQELTRTRGYQSAVDQTVHFGLGTNTQIDSIVVQWLDDKKETIRNVKPDQLLTIDHENAVGFRRTANTDIVPFEEENPMDYGIDFKHTENAYDDFKRELLLPHKNSQHGPHISVGDANGDQLDDFYIGGAAQQAGTLFVQQKNGTFTKTNAALWQEDAASEDINSIFVDVDNDNDLDLYVVSGGNEFEPNANELKDRLYLNNGKGQFAKTSNWLPNIKASGSVAIAHDFNKDGKQDILIGARMKPGQYPLPDQTVLLLNRGSRFEDVTDQFNADLRQIGLVTDGLMVDVTGDETKELVLVGEWMPITIFECNGTTLKDITPDNLRQKTGWWNSVATADLDQDGDQDLVAGNLGLNYKYKAKPDAPFQIYASDFDQTGTLDIVLGYFQNGVAYPVRGRECSSQQMPFIKEKFPSFKSFAQADIKMVYGAALDESYQLKATEFASCVLTNGGNGTFEMEPLSNEAQVSSINAIGIEDFNQDGRADILTVGNFWASEVETPRNDAGVGNLLLNQKDQPLQAVPTTQSGFFAPADVKDLKKIMIKGAPFWLVANNNQELQLFKQQ